MVPGNDGPSGSVPVTGTLALSSLRGAVEAI